MTNHSPHTRNLTDEDRLGRSIAAHLSRASEQVPHDISERLKAARMQALTKRKIVRLQVASVAAMQGGEMALHLGDSPRSLWNLIASLLPLLALVAGLFSITVIAEDQWVDELAEIDAALLTDELPPDAYTDPGFAQFLRLSDRD